MAHLHTLFFSGAVNVPNGANLLSNTSGLLVGVVLAPVTCLFGPVVSTNVALTLAPALSAWGCFVAVRPLVTWKPIAIPAALIYGYSAAIVSSLVFGHVSVTVLVIPTASVHDAARDRDPPGAHGLARRGRTGGIAHRAVLHFARGLRHVAALRRGRSGRGRGGGLAPGADLGRATRCPHWAWRPGSSSWSSRIRPGSGWPGRSPSRGVLFALAPLTGMSALGPPVAGELLRLRQQLRAFRRVPGPQRAASGLCRRRGRAGGGGLGGPGPTPASHLAARAARRGQSLALPRRAPHRRARVVLARLVALGAALEAAGPQGDPARSVRPVHRAVRRRFLIAVGVDAFVATHRRGDSWLAVHRRARGHGAATVLVALLALVPVFLTFNVPLRVVPVVVPRYVRNVADSLPPDDVLLTVPFAVSGSTPADALAGGRRHALPTGRRRAEDTRCHRRAGRHRGARVGRGAF